jgi:hypothetical protein
MFLKNVAEPVGCPEAWRLYFLGPADKPAAAELFQGIARLDFKDKRSAFSGLNKLMQHASEGRDPKAAYPAKSKCHEAFKFKHDHQQYTVWRIRENDVRIYFYYCAGKILLLPHIGEKREDKLTQAQKDHIAKPIKEYLDAEAKRSIHYEEYER